ncbi:MAG: hemerythrin domain-containing protein [Nitrospirae bacterium]|nr:hemerythrin domain-containing protein [Nitrospirota bacterium]
MTRKRKRPFISLSWEHHHGLSLVWRIRRGLERETSAEIILSYVLPFWEQNVAPHFVLEETVLLPVIPQSEPMVQRFWDEHNTLRTQVDFLKKREEKNGLPKKLKSFADLLEGHIRFEERELFPWIVSTLSEEVRESIEQILHSRFHRLVEPETTVFWE